MSMHLFVGSIVMIPYVFWIIKIISHLQENTSIVCVVIHCVKFTENITPTMVLFLNKCNLGMCTFNMALRAFALAE